jgi:hypothetical protein
MKRVLLMTAAGLLLASNAMAGMEQARFALHVKPKIPPCGTKTCYTALCDNPGTAIMEPNYSPIWNSLTTTPGTPLPCSQYVTSAPLLTGQTVYLVIGKATNELVAGCSFGVNYAGRHTPTPTGVDPFFVTFTECSDGLKFPNGGANGDFPNPGGGIRLTWNTGNGCPNGQVDIPPDGVHAVVGSFYLYAYTPDQFQVTGNNNLEGNVPELAVTTCAVQTTDLFQFWGGPNAYLKFCGRVDFGGGAGYNPCNFNPTTSTRQSTWGKIKTQYSNKTE